MSRFLVPFLEQTFPLLHKARNALRAGGRKTVPTGATPPLHYLPETPAYVCTQITSGALTTASHFHGALRTQVGPQHILQPSGGAYVHSQGRLGSRHLRLGVQDLNRRHSLTAVGASGLRSSFVEKNL